MFGDTEVEYKCNSQDYNTQVTHLIHRAISSSAVEINSFSALNHLLVTHSSAIKYFNMCFICPSSNRLSLGGTAHITARSWLSTQYVEVYKAMR
jgi:hypothetical protein